MAGKEPSQYSGMREPRGTYLRLEKLQEQNPEELCKGGLPEAPRRSTELGVGNREQAPAPTRVWAVEGMLVSRDIGERG